MAIPSAPTNFLVVPGAVSNVASWDSVVGATSYNLYWKKDKCPNCYFMNDDDFEYSSATGGATAQIINNTMRLDMPDGNDGGISAYYQPDIQNGDFVSIIDIVNYSPDDLTNGVAVVLKFRTESGHPAGVYGIYIAYSIIAGVKNIRTTKVIDGSSSNYDVTPANEPTKFKIERNGTYLKTYYYVSAAWTLHQSLDFSTDYNIPHQLQFSIIDKNLRGGLVDLDNLIITPSVEDSGTKITGVTSPYNHYPLTPDDVYCYEVTAENVDGESEASLEGFGVPTVNIPAAPVIAGAYDALTDGDSQNTITIPEIYNATIYNIYWSLTSGVTIANGTKIADVTSPYEHIDLTVQNYYYIATAENAEYESVISNEICLKPDFDGKIFNHNDIIISRLLYQYKNRE